MSAEQYPVAHGASSGRLSPSPGSMVVRSPVRRRVAVAALAAAQSLIVLDVTVLNIAAPRLAVDLHLSPLDPRAGYYGLFVGAVPPVARRLGEAFGRRRLFVLGMAIFTVASLVAGLSASADGFEAARSAQGAGGSLATAGAVAMMTDFSTGARALNRALGVYFAASGLAAALGVFVGAVMVEMFSWRWALLVNVPIGSAVVLLALFAMPENPRGPVTSNLAAAVFGSIGLLLVGRGIGGVGENGWSDGRALAELMVAVVLLAVFVDAWAESTPHASAGRAADRGRIGAHAAMFLLAAVLPGMLFLLTCFLQISAGYSVLRNGVALLPAAGVELAACAFGCRLVARFGFRLTGCAAALSAAIGLLWLARITPGSGYASDIMAPMVLTALGCGVILLPVALPQGERGAAPQVLAFTSRQIGLSLGAVILISAYSASLREHTIGEGAPSLPALDNAVLASIHLAFVTAAFLAAAAAAIIALTVPGPAHPGRPVEGASVEVDDRPGRRSRKPPAG